MSRRTFVGTYTAGEVPERLVFTVYDADGGVIPMTGASVTAGWTVGSTVEERTGEIVGDPALGQIGYTWVAGDLETPGRVAGELVYNIDDEPKIGARWSLVVVAAATDTGVLG